MLNFRNVNVLFGCLLALSVTANVVYGLTAFVYPGLFLAYSLILFYGCYYIGSNFFIRVVCSANTNEKVIALSFDDGPVADKTNRILQILESTDTQAAFFCIGNRIKGNEALLRQIEDKGHLIGNHSFSHHFWFDMFGADKMLADMQMMDSETNIVIGKKPKLFRPPYGVTNPNLKRAIVKGGYVPIGWNVRSMDTVIKDETKLLNKVKSKIKPGAVFLFHDTSEATIAILPAFIEQVKLAGYNIIRLDKMLNVQAYA